MILKKINDNHYVILADEKTLSNNGDWYLSHPDYNKAVQWTMPKNTQHEDKQVWINKILYSTQPLEHGTEPFADGVQYVKVFNKIKPLSLSEVEEAINGCSLDNKIAKHLEKNHIEASPKRVQVVKSLVEELVKDKLFAVEQLYTAFSCGRTYEKSNHQGVGQSELVDYIKSLEKTEWDVEITPEGKIVLL